MDTINKKDKISKNNSNINNTANISNIDYHNYDILNVYAKKDKVENIIKCYESFNWKLIHNDENETYSDANALTFIRPHKIKNKDYLQYNQIEMENLLNDIGKCENYKHSKSTIWGLCLFLPIVLLAILVARLYVNTTLSLTFTCSAFAILSVLAIISSIFITKIFKKENFDFEKKYKSLHQNLEKICKQVKENGDK